MIRRIDTLLYGFGGFEMLKTVVVYKSISGFTEKYSTWIADELKADLYEAKRISAENFSSMT